MLLYLLKYIPIYSVKSCLRLSLFYPRYKPSAFSVRKGQRKGLLSILLILCQ